MRYRSRKTIQDAEVEKEESDDEQPKIIGQGTVYANIVESIMVDLTTDKVDYLN